MSNCNNNERKKHVPSTLNARTKGNVNVKNKLQTQDRSDELLCAKDKEFSEKIFYNKNTKRKKEELELTITKYF